MRLLDWIGRLFAGRGQAGQDGLRRRGPALHVILLDGTMSSLRDGQETNVGLTYKLLAEVGQTANLTIYYEAGIQWQNWAETWDVMVGRGINRQIRRAYGVLASRYRPGDRIVLVGYSRGAYAVRSLAGVIDRIGLLQSVHATETNIRTAYRHYEAGGTSDAAGAFREAFCLREVAVEAVAVWDTVKALGLRLPGLWRLTNRRHSFHNHHLGPAIRHGFHALAMDETRAAYAPVLWDCPDGWDGHAEQVWFRGTHGDVGGQLDGHSAARPLANIPLVWMLDRLEACAVPLPDGWRARFPQNVSAPSIGRWRGWARVFWHRRKRVVGRDRSERLHHSIGGPPNTAAPDHPSLGGDLPNGSSLG